MTIYKVYIHAGAYVVLEHLGQLVEPVRQVTRMHSGLERISFRAAQDLGHCNKISRHSWQVMTQICCVE